MRYPREFVVDDQSRNGVTVIVRRYLTGGRVVEASCDCFGSPFRVHTRQDCPNRRDTT